MSQTHPRIIVFRKVGKGPHFETKGWDGQKLQAELSEELKQLILPSHYGKIMGSDVASTTWFLAGLASAHIDPQGNFNMVFIDPGVRPGSSEDLEFNGGLQLLRRVIKSRQDKSQWQIQTLSLLPQDDAFKTTVEGPLSALVVPGRTRHKLYKDAGKNKELIHPEGQSAYRPLGPDQLPITQALWNSEKSDALWSEVVHTAGHTHSVYLAVSGIKRLKGLGTGVDVGPGWEIPGALEELKGIGLEVDFQTVAQKNSSVAGLIRITAPIGLNADPKDPAEWHITQGQMLRVMCWAHQYAAVYKDQTYMDAGNWCLFGQTTQKKLLWLTASSELGVGYQSPEEQWEYGQVLKLLAEKSLLEDVVKKATKGVEIVPAKVGRI